MSNHTPGPWRVRTHKDGDKVVGCFVAANDVNGYPYDAEIMGDDEYHGATERRLADAHLISAAPDLLAALEGALDIINAVMPGKHSTIRAAIAKAKGQS